MAYTHKLATATILTLILTACGGGGSENTITSSSILDGSRYGFNVSRHFLALSNASSTATTTPYDISKIIFSKDSNQVALIKYQAVVGEALAADSVEEYNLTEKRLLITPAQKASDALNGFKTLVVVGEAANSITISPYNEQLYKDTATRTISFSKKTLDGLLLADVAAIAFDIPNTDANLQALKTSGMKFPTGSDALSETAYSENDNRLEFFVDNTTYPSISNWKSTITLPAGGSFQDRQWSGINFSCTSQNGSISTDDFCVVDYNNKVYTAIYHAKGTVADANELDEYIFFNKIAADALESAFKTYFATSIPAK